MIPDSNSSSRGQPARNPIAYRPERKITSLFVAIAAGIGLVTLLQFVQNDSMFVDAGAKSIAFTNFKPIVFGAGFGALIWAVEFFGMKLFGRGELRMVAPINEQDLARELANANPIERQPS